MTDAKTPALQNADIVARNERDIKTMSDVELLGPDYQGWLSEEKSEVARTLRDGEDARSRAERLMARSEALLKRLGENH